MKHGQGLGEVASVLPQLGKVKVGYNYGVST